MNTVKIINVIDALNKLTTHEAILLDIRDEQSFHQGHVIGSLHLTEQSLPVIEKEHGYDMPVMVLCYHGRSSINVARFLLDRGFSEVYSIEGGFAHWKLHYPNQIESTTKTG